MSSIGLAEIGAALGDPARANMLAALAGGRALPAGELAWHGRVGASTASGHLTRLVDTGLVIAERQGRHRYFRIASPLVAQMLEQVMAVAAHQPAPRHRPASRADAALRLARTCYDHLAGRLGVAITDRLVDAGHLELCAEAGVVTESGRRFFAAFGLDLPTERRGGRCFCRPCLDWTERRPHLAGRLGAALADRCFALGWVERMRDSRALAVTRTGQAGLVEVFGVDLSAAAAARGGTRAELGGTATPAGP